MKENSMFYIHGQNLRATHFHWFHKKLPIMQIIIVTQVPIEK